MKKFFLIPAVAIMLAASVSLTSCSKSPADKAIDAIEDATAKIKSCETAEEAQKIAMEAYGKIMEIAQENPDFEGTAEDEARMQKATEALQAAVAEKGFDL